jgi:hypothetical protein
VKSDLIKAKLKAAGIHLGISAVIFVGILYLIVYQWYPDVFLVAEGGWSGIKLMVAVDLVLGPSLTLIIFNHTKPRKEIFFDLSIIAAIQMAALIWGGLQVYSERPVALVMWDGVFYTVTEDYYQKQGLSLKDLESFSDEKPLLILAESGQSLERLEELQRLNQESIPPYAQIHLYSSIKENTAEVFKRRISADVWSDYIDQDISKTEDYIFLGKAKHRNLLVFLDADANLVKLTLRK